MAIGGQRGVMGDESTSGSWWKTLPGVLTAIGALITAIVGGVVGLKQAGLIFPEPHDAGRAQAHSNVPAVDRPAAPAPSPDLAPVGSASSSTPPSTATPTVSLEMDQVRLRDGIYKILSAKIEPYDSERLTLRILVRLTNAGRFDANFTSSSFRLLVDSVPRAPENGLNELVGGNAAKEGEVLFRFPRATRSLVLRIVNLGQDAFIPVHLKP
jgi:hypothetical protein